MPRNYFQRVLKNFNTCGKACTLALALSLTACGGDTVKEFQEEGRKLMQEGNANGAIVFFKNALDKDSKSFELRFDLAKAYILAQKYPQAEAELEKCLLQQPNNVQLLLTAAKFHTDTRKPEKALGYLKEIESAQKPTVETRKLSALNYRFLQKKAEAEQAYKDAIALAPQDNEAKLGLANIYLGTGRKDEGMQIIDALLQEDPDNIEATTVRADIAKAAQDHILAETLFRKLMVLQPKSVSPYFELGSLMLAQNKVKEAEVVLESMRKNFKPNAQEHMLAGMIAFENRQIEQANTFFQQSVEARPSVDGFYRLAVTLHQLKNSESALSNLRRILDIIPTHGPSLMLTGQILLDQKRYEEAEREVKRFVDLYNKSAQGFYLLGTIQNIMGKKDEALISFNKALEINPKLSQATTTRASILFSQNNEQEAVTELERGVQANSDSVAARTALFNYYMSQNDYARAFEVVDAGLVEQPNHPLLLTLKASVLSSQKRSDEAMANLQKAYSLHPTFMPSTQLLLNLYMVQNKTQEALDICDAVLEKNPENIAFLVTSAVLLDTLKREDEATQRLEKANALNSPRALSSLVRRALQAKDIAKAEKYIADKLAATPTPQLRSMLASFYSQQNDMDKALAVYGSEELQKSPESLLGKFRIYATAQKYTEAIAQAEAIIKLDAQAAGGYILKAMALEQNDNFDAAFTTLEDAYKKTQATALLMQLGELCLRKKQYTKALSYYHTVLVKEPKNKDALVGQGYAYLLLKEFNKSVQSYEKAIELYPEDVIILNNLASALAEEGKNTERAVDLATKAYVDAPENIAVIDTYAFALIANKQVQEALNVIENGLKAHPNSGMLYYRLGVALLAESKRNEGIKALQKAVEHGSFTDLEKAKQLLKDLL